MKPSVFIRVLLRYVAGVLVAKGFLDPSFGDFLVTDPEIATAIYLLLATLASAFSEVFYFVAKRIGWAT